MRQSKWKELLKDYNNTIKYNHGRANALVDSLSRKATRSL